MNFVFFKRIENILFSRETVLYRRLLRSGCKQVVIYGAGELGLNLKRKIEEGYKGIDIIYWIDIRAYKTSEMEIEKLPVKTIHQLADIPVGCAVVLATKGSVIDMLFFCRKFKVETKRIVF